MRIYMHPNLDKVNCYESTCEAAAILLGGGAQVCINESYRSVFSTQSGICFANEDEGIASCDIIIAVGGDGTILKCSKRAARHGKPVLGINCGRLGFMASLEHTQLGKLEKLLNGDFSKSRRMMLEAKFSVQGKEKSYTALNDIIIAKSDDCKIADYKVSKKGRVISSLRADGVIFSTATGATAYSMSAGGPIIEPEMECIEFSHVCAHSLFARTMILSADSNISVSVATRDQSHVWVNIDGNNVARLTDGDTVRVTRSKYYIDIIDIAGGSFFSSVHNKLMMPLKGTEEEEAP
ncbi:MAG: NAD(+)/NADH kinase [Ruminococcus sp.]|nr:NAD(+)/NADH kinase [Ruminococcus sp.]